MNPGATTRPRASIVRRAVPADLGGMETDFTIAYGEIATHDVRSGTVQNHTAADHEIVQSKPLPAR